MSKFQARDVKDRIVQYPNRYALRDTASGAVTQVVDLEPVPGTVAQEGTRINRAFQQPLENWLAETPKVLPAKGCIPIADEARRELGGWQNCVELTAASAVTAGMGVKMTASGVVGIGTDYSQTPTRRASGNLIGVSANIVGQLDETSFITVQQSDTYNSVTLAVYTVEPITGVFSRTGTLTTALSGDLAKLWSGISVEVNGGVGVLLFNVGNTSWVWPFSVAGQAIQKMATAPVALVTSTTVFASCARPMEGQATGTFLISYGTKVSVVTISTALAVTVGVAFDCGTGDSSALLSPLLAPMTATRAMLCTVTSGSTVALRVFNTGSGVPVLAASTTVTVNTAGYAFDRVRLERLNANTCVLVMRAYNGSAYLNQPMTLVTLNGSTLTAYASGVSGYGFAIKPLSDNQFALLMQEYENSVNIINARVYTVSGTSTISTGLKSRVSPDTGSTSGLAYPMPRSPLMVVGNLPSNWAALWLSSDNSTLVGIACEDIAKGGKGLVAVAPGRVPCVTVAAGVVQVYFAGGSMYSGSKPYTAALPIGFRDTDGTLIFTGNRE